MRAVFPKIVERGRNKGAPLASSPGDTFGFFWLKHPRTGRRFKVMVGDDEGWDHVSVSVGHGNNRSAKPPSWDEMCWIKQLFFGAHEAVVQYHPPDEEHVNVHNGCLHLWRPHNVEIPMPPKWMVG